MLDLDSTIIAPATASAISALGIIRMSGKDALKIADKIFEPINNKKFLSIVKPNHLYYGTIHNHEKIIDEVVISVFISPNSFTGEDTVEITHHGSIYIQNEIIKLCLNNGAKIAGRGEFSKRAFLNGKINLSQAEAIADLIASDSKAAHDVAMQQLRGGYDKELKTLRKHFLNIASLLELEIDFSAEQEVFVDRKELKNEIDLTIDKISTLLESFSTGNAFKNGIAVAIIGKVNSGKSTLMNALLKDNRSIVSNEEGTTRDTVEETIIIDGIKVRMIDTAGIRDTQNSVEREGIKRSFDALERANIIINLFDGAKESSYTIDKQLDELNRIICLKNKYLINAINKDDISTFDSNERENFEKEGFLLISAKKDLGIDSILEKINSFINKEDINGRIFVSNLRHYEAFKSALKELREAKEALIADASSDLVSENIRSASKYLGEITGEVTNEDVLNSIFSTFCIGK